MLACPAAFALQSRCAGRMDALCGHAGIKRLFIVIAARAGIFYAARMKQNLVIFLYPGIVALDVTGPLEVFATATQLLKLGNRHNDGYTPVFAATRCGSVRSASGLSLIAEVTLGSTRPDILLVPGGPDAESAAEDPQVKRQVRAAAGAQPIPVPPPFFQRVAGLPFIAPAGHKTAAQFCEGSELRR